MADAGVGEAAAAEGAKSAGEVAAGSAVGEEAALAGGASVGFGAADAAAVGAAGLSGADAAGYFGAGTAAGDAGAASISGAAGLGAADAAGYFAAGTDAAVNSSGDLIAMGGGLGDAAGGAIPSATGTGALGPIGGGGAGGAVAGGGTAGGGGLSLPTWRQTVGGLDMARGFMGLNAAKQVGQQSDPMAPYRAQYAQQLQQLQANPNSITSMPGYEAGLEAVQRTGAAQGYTGSGNMAAALQKYGGDFYQQQFQNLSGLAGAGTTPGNNSSQAAMMQMMALSSLGNGALLM